MRPVASQLDERVDRPQALIDFARDVARLSAELGDQRLAATARHAEDVARAAAAGDERAAGRAAADCLFSRRADGSDFIVAEARAVTAGIAH
jgi:hypothetical protein